LGQAYPGIRRKQNSTVVQTSASGNEVRVANYQFPRFQWEMPFNWLSGDPAIEDFQTLLGFLESRAGAFDSFLFVDPDDCYVAAQFIGTGDGVTKNFQLQRTFGSFTQPVYEINGVIANYPTESPPAVAVYIDGVLQSSGYTISSTDPTVPALGGLLKFTVAPPAPSTGHPRIITADFAYFWRVRLLEDESEFSVMGQETASPTAGANIGSAWECRKIVLQSCKF